MSKFPLAARVALLAFCGSTLIWAQSKTGALVTGVVKDPAGAVVPGTTITLLNTENGSRLATESDAEGVYQFPVVPAGAYSIEAEKSGFAKLRRTQLEINVGAAVTVDLNLQITTSDSVDVVADVASIETERTQQSNTINQGAVRNLPINRRDYLTFTLLAPGVADSKAQADANSFRVKQTPDSGLSFYGSNGRGNNISVDGGSVNDAGGGVRPTVSQEAVQEFQVNRTNYSAEHGSSRGGVVNIITKSGSNNWHGSGFAFFRHQSLDAGDPFALNLTSSGLQRVKPDANRQQWGATLGGPVAKDKTFFFLAYENLRRRESKTIPVLTNTAIFGPTREQEAVLGQLPAAAATQLRAALSSPAPVRQLFERNSGIFPFSTDDHKGLARLDHRFSDSSQLTFRFNTTSIYDTNEGVGALVGFSRGFVQRFRDYDGQLNWTKTFGTAAVNEFRSQFDHYLLETASTDAFGPALEIAGFGLFNRDRFLPNKSQQRWTELADNFTWIRGRHQFKFGGVALIRNTHNSAATFMSGRFTFGSLPGALVNPALASVSITAMQAFNLGLAQSYQQGFGDPLVKATHPLYGVYFQDQWNAGHGLTLNYGLRYEVDTRRTPLPTDRNNWAPRFGFAWDPTGSRKTTIRGGYGLFFAPIDFQIDYTVNALNEINGYRQIAQVLSVLSPTAPTAINGPINIYRTLLAQGTIGLPTPQRSIQAADLRQFGINVSQTGPRPPLTVLFRPSPDYQNPYAQQISFGIERELARNTSVTLSYVGVRGLHLTTSLDANLLPAPVNPAKGIRDWGVTPANPTGLAFFRDPLLFQENIYESTAVSSFHGFMLEATNRLNRNATFHFNYTFSKAIDETTDYNSDFQPNDQTSRRAEKALSSFDQRHKVVAYGVFQAGGGKQGLARLWENGLFTPIFRYNSARPFNLLAGTELNNDRHNTTDRPYFAGRNTGIGPSFWTFDARLSKNFVPAEGKRLELMIEGFNLFNKLNYASVNNIVGNIAGPFNLRGRDDRGPSDPLGFTSVFDPRRMQLGLRFSF